VADEVTPFPKALQLARKQWQAISAAKMGPCRVCLDRSPYLLELHHLVSREDHGNDVADNLVPLCRPCHEAI
jgi:5-methylcytosine-specific restriction endonuclease McrA